MYHSQDIHTHRTYTAIPNSLIDAKFFLFGRPWNLVKKIITAVSQAKLIKKIPFLFPSFFFISFPFLFFFVFFVCFFSFLLFLSFSSFFHFFFFPFHASCFIYAFGFFWLAYFTCPLGVSLQHWSKNKFYSEVGLEWPDHVTFRENRFNRALDNSLKN